MSGERSGSLSRVGVVFEKEVIDNLRDRRSVVSALVSTMIGPVLMVAMIIVVGKGIMSNLSETSFKLPVAGVEHAPNLVQFLEQNGVEVLKAPEDPETAVRNGDVEMVLVVDEGYGEDFKTGQPAQVRMVVDTSRQTAIATRERTRQLLRGFNEQLAYLRLIARGINPTVIQPLQVVEVDVSTPQTQALVFLNMMPYFIVLVVFLGGMYVVIDATAGERERGSLEPLLISPLPRWEFVMGKLLASLPFATFSVFITLLVFAIAFKVIPLEKYIGYQLAIDLGAMFSIFLISLPMVVLASALQMVVATFARSFKEAQTYVGFLPLVLALPGIGLAFIPVKSSLWLMLIPTFGQQMLINQFMRGEQVNPLNIFVSSTMTILATLGLILLAIQLYKREQIIFGTK